ncbi:hypothetical protein C8Q73DRAFT_795126 [Cubamyces lactineus]|nr:hypothetical protein C8Q73DRAFT_795126 [Cubamyces lactineus]
MSHSLTPPFFQEEDDAALPSQMPINHPDAPIVDSGPSQLQPYNDCMDSLEYAGEISQNGDAIYVFPATSGLLNAPDSLPTNIDQLESPPPPTIWYPQFAPTIPPQLMTVDNVSLKRDQNVGALSNLASIGYVDNNSLSFETVAPQTPDRPGYSTQVNVPAEGVPSMAQAQDQDFMLSANTLSAQDLPLDRLLLIPQTPYKSTGDKYVPQIVNASAALARKDALPAMFYKSSAAAGVGRAGKKFQVRFKFNGSEDFTSKQHNKYCVEKHWSNFTQLGPKRKTRQSPCSIGSLLHIIAYDLHDFMVSLGIVLLKNKGAPLRLNSFEVDFNDILIVDCRNVYAAERGAPSRAASESLVRAALTQR